MALTVEIYWTRSELVMFAFPPHAFPSENEGLLVGKLLATGSYNGTESNYRLKSPC